jgi:valyl-tRNA synthetase
LHAVTVKVNEALADYRFHEAAYEVYHFFWHEICDWYLEWVKPEITRVHDGAKVSPAWVNLVRVFESALRVLHPFMPFITEELSCQLPRAGGEGSISVAAFDLTGKQADDPVSEKQFGAIQDLIVSLRNAKAEMGLQKVKPSAQVACEDARLLELFRSHLPTILRLAAFQALNFNHGRLEATASGVRVGALCDLRVFHEEPVDPEAERGRLKKEKEKLEGALAQAKKQLENKAFMDRAPREVVRGVEHRYAELTEHYKKVVESLERLG